MAFEILDTLSLPGDAQKPNEDFCLADPFAAVVMDGATMVSEPLLPGKSDPAWLAQLGARRLMAHIKAGASARGALRHAIADAERSFLGLRRRAPQARYEMPFASMIFAMASEAGFEALWFGDCEGIFRRPGEAAETIGTALAKKDGEARAAKAFQDKTGLAPVEALKREDYIFLFREGRVNLNTPGGPWLFAPESGASEHVSHQKIAAPAGTHVLLCTDGFLALTAAYGRYDPAWLLDAALAKGLTALGEDLRGVETADPEGLRYPRFKPSDDATAVLLTLV